MAHGVAVAAEASERLVAQCLARYGPDFARNVALLPVILGHGFRRLLAF
jgi:hypothetical protein